jgi:hypothetical protein
LETIPFVPEPRTASRRNDLASAAARPTAIAVYPRGIESVLDHRTRGRFPQPVADLFVKGFDVVRLDDARVITQAVEQLRPVRLRIDRLQLVVFDERLLFGTVRFRLTSKPRVPIQIPAIPVTGPRLTSVSTSGSGSV